MSASRENNLVIGLVIGGALFYWWRQQQAAQSATGASGTITGDLDTLTSNVANYVQSSIIGSTRGERNNNPGNIRRTTPQTPWVGLSTVQNDPDFCQFTDVRFGIRACRVNFTTYFTKYGLNTVTGLISRWAPPNENSPAIYIANVCKWMNVTPNQTLDLTNAATMASLVNAVICQENGSNPYIATGQFAAGMALA